MNSIDRSAHIHKDVLERYLHVFILRFNKIRLRKRKKKGEGKATRKRAPNRDRREKETG